MVRLYSQIVENLALAYSLRLELSKKRNGTFPFIQSVRHGPKVGTKRYWITGMWVKRETSTRPKSVMRSSGITASASRLSCM